MRDVFFSNLWSGHKHLLLLTKQLSQTWLEKLMMILTPPPNPYTTKNKKEKKFLLKLLCQELHTQLAKELCQSSAACTRRKENKNKSTHSNNKNCIEHKNIKKCYNNSRWMNKHNRYLGICSHLRWAWRQTYTQSWSPQGLISIN